MFVKTQSGQRINLAMMSVIDIRVTVAETVVVEAYEPEYCNPENVVDARLCHLLGTYPSREAADYALLHLERQTCGQVPYFAEMLTASQVEEHFAALARITAEKEAREEKRKADPPELQPTQCSCGNKLKHGEKVCDDCVEFAENDPFA